MGQLSSNRVVSSLDGLASIEGANGERRVARGLSQRGLDAAMSQWACEQVDDECAICLVPGETATRATLRLPCGHCFCADCVAPWLKRCAICPMCRQGIRSPKGNAEQSDGNNKGAFS